MSVNATNPAELFGGTWEQIKGRFLLGAGPNDENTTDFWGPEWAGHVNAPAGELGGEALHTLSAAELKCRHTHIQFVYGTRKGQRETHKVHMQRRMAQLS